MPDRRQPPLVWADAWILTALLTHGIDGGQVRLAELLFDMDWVARLAPTFDELSYGIPRLQMAGFVRPRTDERGELSLMATPAALRFLTTNADGTGGHGSPSLFRVQAAIGATGVDEMGKEDRSLGRLRDFQQAAFDAAYSEYSGDDAVTNADNDRGEG